MKPAVLDLGVALPRYALDLCDLASARGVDPAKYASGLGGVAMGVPAPGEDTVTMAASAAASVLDRHPGAAADVGLCIVGTESATDRARPIAIEVHALAGLPAECSVFDVKHACYGATAGLHMAFLWVAANPSRKALVVAADIARYGIGSAAEPTQGAGAVALLLGMADEDEALFAPWPMTGTHAAPVHDFWQPPYLREAVVRGRYSIECYLDSLAGAYAAWLRNGGLVEGSLDRLLFHSPFPGMARKAHARLWELSRGADASGAADDFARRVAPGLAVNAGVGNCYAAAVYLSLAGLVEAEGASLQGLCLGGFSYGSGSCGEFFGGRFGRRAAAGRVGLAEALAAREPIDVAGYERARAECEALEHDGSFREDRTGAGGRFTFLGIRDHVRVYR